MPWFTEFPQRMYRGEMSFFARTEAVLLLKQYRLPWINCVRRLNKSSFSSKIDRPSFCPGGFHLRRTFSKACSSSEDDIKPILPSFDEEFGEKLDSKLLNALSSSNFKAPSQFQAQSISAILGKQSVILNSPTGSGKTLSYLIPAFQFCVDTYNQIQRESDSDPKWTHDAPAVLILVPNRELMVQIKEVSMPFTKKTGIDVTLLNPGQKYHTLLPGIWVTTPQILSLNERLFKNSCIPNLKMIVFDEVDHLIQNSSGKWTTEILRVASKERNLRKDAPNPFVIVFSGATIPNSGGKTTGNLISRKVKDALWIRTSHTHAFDNSLLQQSFFKLDLNSSNPGNVSTIIQSVTKSVQPNEKTIIFVNSPEIAARVHTAMKNTSSFRDVFTGVLNSSTSFNERISSLRKFNALRQKAVMICTDLGSRGLDFKDVNHVIQGEFATNVVDYLHRVGRTARFGKSGRITSFYSSDREELASRIMASINNQTPLESCFSRKRSLRKRIKKRSRSSSTPSSPPSHASQS